jgi:hypothetical protein
MKGVGRDGTSLFSTFRFDFLSSCLPEISEDKKHHWVNAEGMLSKTLVGLLVYD